MRFSPMDCSEFNVFFPHNPDSLPRTTRLYRPDFLDIAIMKSINLQFDFENLKNLNDLSSDHNPLIITYNEDQDQRHGQAPNKLQTLKGLK